MNASDVLFSARKYDGSLHWHCTMLRLGEDDHGIWLGMPAGTVHSKGDTGPVYESKEARVKLIPRDAWWTALFLDAPQRLDAYCDVTTPSRWPNPGEVTMVDLDLDVCRVREGGDIFIDDRDEFADHQVRYSYPPDVITRAAASARWLQAALRTSAEPFNSHFRAWLDKVR
ncbi:DUF402 domain-containing protein [Streptomyces sp. 900116325]